MEKIPFESLSSAPDSPTNIIRTFIWIGGGASVESGLDRCIENLPNHVVGMSVLFVLTVVQV